MKTILLKHRPVDPDSPAFVHDAGKPWPENTSGLTVRAEIASRIMAGLCSNDIQGLDSPHSQYYTKGRARLAVEAADALLARLNSNPDET